jgi:acetoin utilization deacetylase AcuC-like enzyme
VWSHHRFDPTAARVVERALPEGVVAPADLAEPRPALWADLARVHDERYLDRLRAGTLTEAERRTLREPWSTRFVSPRPSTEQACMSWSTTACSG